MLNVMRRAQSLGLALALALLMSSTLAVAGPATTPSPVDLNTASVEQLTELPGIGPALASRIVEYREKAGQFESVEELMNVRGIGEKSFAKLEPHVRVGSEKKKTADQR